MTRTIKASDFKTRCLALIDEVAASGEAIVITKRGKAVVRLEPYRPAPATPFGRSKGRKRTADPTDDLVDIIDEQDIADWHREDPAVTSARKPSSSKARRRKQQPG